MTVRSSIDHARLLEQQDAHAINVRALVGVGPECPVERLERVGLLVGAGGRFLHPESPAAVCDAITARLRVLGAPSREIACRMRM